jgi:hypothetical protein
MLFHCHSYHHHYTTTAATTTLRTTATSNCSWGGNSATSKWRDNGNATSAHHQAKRNNNAMMELWEMTEQRGGGKANGKRPQRRQTMSLGLFTSFFFMLALFFVVANDLF